MQRIDEFIWEMVMIVVRSYTVTWKGRTYSLDMIKNPVVIHWAKLKASDSIIYPINTLSMEAKVEG